MSVSELQYLELLSKSYPNIASVSAEINRIDATLSLPKPTELFASDIHGEYEAFSHVVRNGSGVMRNVVEGIFTDTLSADKKHSLLTLLYYPTERAKFILSRTSDSYTWLSEMISQVVFISSVLIKQCESSRIQSAFAGEEGQAAWQLVACAQGASNPNSALSCCKESIDFLIAQGDACQVLIALCHAIQRLVVDRLHLVGDVYDRGPLPHSIMDMLMDYPSLDIQWGNHDVVWMGAALGQRGCIAHVVRNCARYGNLSILEDAYGINLHSLAAFAMKAYADDPCVAFGLKGNPDLSPEELELNVKIQKAMTILQFKVEAQLIDENPCFELGDRKLLHRINTDNGTIVVDGVEYELTDKVFPTVDWDNPYTLTFEEEQVMQSLEQAFMGCEKLQQHMRFLLDAGSLYKICDNNLLFHACVPLNADGSLKEANIYGTLYKGRSLYEISERYVRAAFDASDNLERKRGRDLLWWLWLGEGSPLFAKSKMATFELYLIAEKAARKEVKNPFYSSLEDKDVLAGIFKDFGMNSELSRIVCGHVPVKAKDGESPLKCGGRVLTIDGGFSRAYQPTTGIAGYTLISNDKGMVLAAHEPLESRRAAIENGVDICSTYYDVLRPEKPVCIADTAEGAALIQRKADLVQLLDAYRNGLLKEQ